MTMHPLFQTVKGEIVHEKCLAGASSRDYQPKAHEDIDPGDVCSVCEEPALIDDGVVEGDTVEVEPEDEEVDKKD